MIDFSKWTNIVARCREDENVGKMLRSIEAEYREKFDKHICTSNFPKDITVEGYMDAVREAIDTGVPIVPYYDHYPDPDAVY